MSFAGIWIFALIISAWPQTLPAQAMGSAKLVILRSGQSTGSTVSIRIDQEHEAAIGRLNYTEFDLTPGTHFISAQNLKRPLRLTVVDGETQYLLLQVHRSLLTMDCSFEKIDKEEADYLLKDPGMKRKPSKPVKKQIRQKGESA